METIVSTIYGTAQHVAKEFGIPYVYEQKSTLNEALNINPQAIFAVTNPTPRIAYLAIGNGGHKMLAGAGGQFQPVPVQHEATDGGLYNQIPFVMVPVSNDLTPTEQANYALKTIISVGGEDYATYFLKRIDLSGIGIVNTVNSITNGVTSTQTFTPEAVNLQPTPPAIQPTSVTTQSSDYIKSTIKIPLSLSAKDIVYLQKVCQLYPGAKKVPIISELALCSGIDDTTLNDAIGVQVNVFINSLLVLKYNLNGFDYSFDFGSSQPLYNPINV